MKKECCENCRYWKDGMCQRYPPVVTPDVQGDAADIWTNHQMLYPETLKDNWCGEFKFTQEYLNESRKTLKVDKLFAGQK